MVSSNEIKTEFKLGGITIKLDSEEIKKLLKSSEITEALKDTAKEISKDIENIQPGDWEIEEHMRPSRSTIVIKTDSIETKWKEVNSGKIAKYIRGKNHR